MGIRKGHAKTGRTWAALVFGAFVTGAFVLAGPTHRSSASEAPIAYVTNSSDDNVTPINLADDSTGATIAVGDFPVAVAVTPNGATAYVVNEFSNSVTPITTTDNTPQTPIRVGTFPVAIAITPDGSTAYVVNKGGWSRAAGTITPINIAKGTTSRALHVGPSPDAIAISPNGQDAYVSDAGNGKVSVVDLVTGVTVASVAVGKHPGAIALTPDGATAYVVIAGDNTVIPFNTTTYAPGQPIAAGPAGTEPTAITIRGDTAYVTNKSRTAGAPGSVTTINTSDNTVGKSITVGSAPRGIAISPDGSTAYVVDTSDDAVSLIATATGQVEPGTVRVGGDPTGIAITPAPEPPATTGTSTTTTEGTTTTVPTTTSGTTTTSVPTTTTTVPTTSGLAGMTTTSTDLTGPTTLSAPSTTTATTTAKTFPTASTQTVTTAPTDGTSPGTPGPTVTTRSPSSSVPAGTTTTTAPVSVRKTRERTPTPDSSAGSTSSTVTTSPSRPQSAPTTTTSSSPTTPVLHTGTSPSEGQRTRGDQTGGTHASTTTTSRTTTTTTSPYTPIAPTTTTRTTRRPTTTTSVVAPRTTTTVRMTGTSEPVTRMPVTTAPATTAPVTTAPVPTLPPTTLPPTTLPPTTRSTTPTTGATSAHTVPTASTSTAHAPTTTTSPMAPSRSSHVSHVSHVSHAPGTPALSAEPHLAHKPGLSVRSKPAAGTGRGTAIGHGPPTPSSAAPRRARPPSATVRRPLPATHIAAGPNPGRRGVPPAGGQTRVTPPGDNALSSPSSKPKRQSLHAVGATAQVHHSRGPDVDYERSVGTGPHGGPPGLVPLAQAVPTVGDISWAPRHVAGNLALAALLLLLVSLPAQLFNQTLRTYHDQIVASTGSVRQAIVNLEALIHRLPSHGLYGALVVAGAALYACADPTFAFNASGFAELAGFVGAIAFSGAMFQYARGWYLRHKFKKVGRFRVMPLGVLAALVLVSLSRAGNFEPGYVFGIFATLSFRAPPTQQEEGRSYAVAAVWLMAISAVIWFALVPVREAVDHGHTGLGFLLLDSLFATIWVCGLQAIVFGYLPLRGVNGAIVMAWSKRAWLAIYAFAMVVFVATVLHPTAAGYGANRDANLLSVLYPFLGFMTASVLFWVYATVRYHRRTPAARKTAPTATDDDLFASSGEQASARRG